ncbi:hypothetical protein FA13DRAFT_1711761 [Coprinellus micaceus]|uniref:Uncharacterized protein n=1 Tax=Coprinellus micaceus TaxID=71717 RepID=A0A4Y7T364_COPMI|nr:hypothetical protein FA13DRAFT_1711761 [Coprinellus micaceus]
MDVLSHLLMTNTAPNQLEGQYIQGQIQTRSDAIEKLQLELQACKALLSPLCRFPLENLGEIFTATLGPGESIFTPRSPRQLVQLRLVCKAWWHAALATPQLWCSVQIGFNHNSVCFEGRCLQRLSELVDPQPWDSIHAFKFQAPALVETRATSAHLTLCLELDLSYWGPSWYPNYDAGSVMKLPNLYTLQITGSAGLSCHSVLDSLETPCLTSLDMKLNIDHYPYDWEDHLEL